jgi:hypothetical protein
MRGGMEMKASVLLGLLLLIGFTAAPAKADGDPNIIVNRGSDPVCPPAPGADYVCFEANSKANPLITPEFDPANFVWDGPGNLTDLFIEFTFIPGQLYTCSSDIFAQCGPNPPPNSPSVEDFEFTGSDATHPGFIVPGDEFVAGPAAEPQTLLLLGTGIISLLGFRRKRTSAN